MKKIWQADWSCNKKDMFMPLILVCVMFAAGFTMVQIIMHFDLAEDYVLMGSLMALAGMYLSSLRFAMDYSKCWRIYGGMGARRRDFFLYMLLRQLVILTLSCGLILIFAAVETRIGGLLYAELPNLTDLSILYRTESVLLLIGSALLLHMLTAAVAVRFGSNGTLAVYLILAFAVIFVINTYEVRDWILQTSLLVWGLSGAVIFIVGACFIASVTKKMAVK